MKALVTGAAGFVGRHAVERLVSEGHDVVATDIMAEGLQTMGDCGADRYACDLCDPDALLDKMKGVDTVFHVAAFASPWGNKKKFWAINVGGTENVIRAARRASVRRIVAVSSTSAVFDGRTPHENIDETTPYPLTFLHPYSETKSVSERLVRSANSSDLETVVVRPHLIWGPRDRTFLKRLVDHAKEGPIFHIGGGMTMTDTTYVDNLVEGMILAAITDKGLGNAYFITNGEPLRYGEFIDRFLDIFELPKTKGSIPVPVAQALGVGFEAVWAMFRIKREPMLSRYKLAELIRTHTYNISGSERDLGYRPIVTTEEGFVRIKEWVDAEGMAGKGWS